MEARSVVNPEAQRAQQAERIEAFVAKKSNGCRLTGFDHALLAGAAALREQKDHGAGLIHQPIPDMAGSEPRLKGDVYAVGNYYQASLLSKRTRCPIGVTVGSVHGSSLYFGRWLAELINRSGFDAQVGSAPDAASAEQADATRRSAAPESSSYSAERSSPAGLAAAVLKRVVIAYDSDDNFETLLSMAIARRVLGFKLTDEDDSGEDALRANGYDVEAELAEMQAALLTPSAEEGK